MWCSEEGALGQGPGQTLGGARERRPREGGGERAGLGAVYRHGTVFVRF